MGCSDLIGVQCLVYVFDLMQLNGMFYVCDFVICDDDMFYVIEVLFIQWDKMILVFIGFVG